MFGDYYTNDLISASPRTNMLGNEINLFIQGGPQKNLGASLVIVLMVILSIGMLYYVFQTTRDAGDSRDRHACARARDRARGGPAAGAAAPPAPRRLRNPWGRPRFMVALTWLYVIWALVPVVIAMLFSFNDGRSRSVWQGFSIRWWWGDPSLSIFHDPDYMHALVHSLRAGGARHADRDAARRAAGARPGPLARPGLGRSPTG